MHGFDSRITGEVRAIEGEKVNNIVGEHSGGQLCVVNLNTANIVRDEERTPSRIDLRVIRQQGHEVFQIVQCERCGRNRKTVTIPLYGAGRNIPELRRILERVVQHATLGPQLADGVTAEWMLF
jgi:hypothetical protein